MRYAPHEWQIVKKRASESRNDRVLASWSSPTNQPTRGLLLPPPKTGQGQARRQPRAPHHRAVRHRGACVRAADSLGPAGDGLRRARVGGRRLLAAGAGPGGGPEGVCVWMMAVRLLRGVKKGYGIYSTVYVLIPSRADSTGTRVPLDCAASGCIRPTHTPQ